MTKAEREAAIAEARAERAAELDRRRRDPLPPVPKAEIVVCTNNACAKRGAKELKAELERVGASVGTGKCTVKGARCMDACGAGCVVKVNGAGGLETFMHVAASEAAAVMELATGERVTSEAPAR
jgi:NADH:ubiquinone oxidoreductase subunit E